MENDKNIYCFIDKERRNIGIKDGAVSVSNIEMEETVRKKLTG